jgi:hypothetical protein
MRYVVKVEQEVSTKEHFFVIVEADSDELAEIKADEGDIVDASPIYQSDILGIHACVTKTLPSDSPLWEHVPRDWQ